MSERHALAFEQLGDVMPMVDRLLTGYDRLGNWSLGQIAFHLATAIRLTTLAHKAGAVAEVVDVRKAEVLRRRFFQSGRFPENVVIPIDLLIPAPDLDDRDQGESLRRTIARFEASQGPYPPHPYLGPLTKDEWSTFHKMHCAHHLSFVQPDEHDFHEGAPA